MPKIAERPMRLKKIRIKRSPGSAGIDTSAQTRIAEECGRQQPAISKRMARLGILSAGNAGRPRIIPGNNSSDTEALEPPDDDDIVDGEVVEDDDPSPGARHCAAQKRCAGNYRRCNGARRGTCANRHYCGAAPSTEEIS